MLEIRFHGRGGQGALVAARILASAFAKEGKDVLVVPEFGSERRSAPVAVGLRVDENKILLRSKIYNPDIVIILDNSDADAIARKYKLGPASLPVVGTAMLGAFAKATGLVRLESILEAAQESDELPKKEGNIRAIREMFDITESRGLGSKPDLNEAPFPNLRFLPLSVISLGDTRVNKTGTWRRIGIEYSPSEDTISTCMDACPIHQDIREWLLAMKTGSIKKAAEIILRHNPLAGSVSRVCPVFCEKGCRYFRNGFDEPIAVNAIEKFLGDWIVSGDYSPGPVKICSNKKVAVIGSGPAGLTCAYVLRQKGYLVTIFEKMPALGGLLRFGIPEDRLPKEIVAKEAELIGKAGVELRCGAEINENNFNELRKDFQAIFLAPGFSDGKKLNILGADLEGVITALDFLKEVYLGRFNESNLRGKTIIVIGAGNTAMDSARTAQKLGAARVIVVYRRKKENMKAFGNEVEETERAGVQFNFEMTPLKIVQNIMRGLLTEFQNKDLKVIFACDLVIMAVGQQKSPFFEKLLKEKSLEQLEKEGIFVGGDLLTGPKTVAHAIGTGNEAAKKIAVFLENRKYCRGKIRRQIKRDSINFDYFNPMLRTAETQRESQRCFTCGFCDRCGNCWVFCPDMAISEEEKGLKINYDFCKGCQICSNECPRGVIVEEKNA